jgi:hypothetical protein
MATRSVVQVLVVEVLVVEVLRGLSLAMSLVMVAS